MAMAIHNTPIVVWQERITAARKRADAIEIHHRLNPFKDRHVYSAANEKQKLFGSKRSRRKVSLAKLNLPD
jgi:hypothetical protein